MPLFTASCIAFVTALTPLIPKHLGSWGCLHMLKALCIPFTCAAE